MITRSRSRIMESQYSEQSQSPDINNQLGYEMSEEINITENRVTESEGVTEETPQTEPENYSTGARGTSENIPNALEAIMRMIQQTAEEQRKYADKGQEEQKKLSEKFDKSQEEQKKLFEKFSKEIDEKIARSINTKFDELSASTQKSIQTIENKINEQEKKIDTQLKKNENELKSMSKKLEKNIKDTKEEFSTNARIIQEGNSNKFVEIETKLQQVVTSTKDTAEKIDAVSVEKGRRLDEVCQKINSITEQQDRLQRRVENHEGRPNNRNEVQDVSRDITYDGTSHFPMEFLKEMEEIQEVYYSNENTRWIAKHLTDSAAVWWRIVKSQVTTFEQFKEAFIEKFWSSSDQQRIRDYLEFGRYQPDRNMDMVSYLEHQVLRSRQLLPRLDDQQLIKKLGRHYTREIQIALVTRGVSTIAGFESILREYMEIKPPNSNEPYQQQKNKQYSKGEQPIVKKEGYGQRFNAKETSPKWHKYPDKSESSRPIVNTLTVEKTPTEPSTSRQVNNAKNGSTNGENVTR